MPHAHPPLRSGVIGTGGIAHAHAAAIAALPGQYTLAGVTDVDQDRAVAFAAEMGSERVFPDAQSLLASGEIDIVHICTPPGTHADLSIQAMRAGVTALVEKPTALSLAEFDRVARIEAETGVQTLTVFQHRFGPAAEHLRRLAAEGALGRPLIATCETLWFRPDEYFDVPWRGRWDIEGGGPTMGHGIHQFDLLLSVLGPWDDITAIASRQSRPTDTEDVSLSLVRFAGGAVASVVNSLVSPRETSRLRFDFEHATIEVEHLYGYTSADWTFTPAPGHEHLADAWIRHVEGEAPSSHRDQFSAIAAALAEGERAGVDIADARRTLEFAAATYAASFGGARIASGEIVEGTPFYDTMHGGIVPWETVKEVVA
ncbi:Gfo/Idh/MocA family protein [Microbacterium sp. G2-8]|uniref:Gfo/Idh/MocA family protein n=1 Tax=Microbacterium sp. G2-8 TaxID=2842454 RepID=UPI001C88EB96|nr:Gfo/Idh/MocA family oxidoreductase [Microbacterium sp. G2-8]